MYIDDRLVETMELPTNVTRRRFTPFWQYGLPDGKHTVRLRVRDPVRHRIGVSRAGGCLCQQAEAADSLIAGLQSFVHGPWPEGLKTNDYSGPWLASPKRVSVPIATCCAKAAYADGLCTASAVGIVS